MSQFIWPPQTLSQPSASPIPVIAGGTIVETRYHDAASRNIDDSGGAFVELEGDDLALGSDVTRVQIASAIGEPLEIAVAADATAAATSETKLYLNRGGSISEPFVIASGQKLWVRSLTSVDVSEGIITVNLIG